MNRKEMILGLIAAALLAILLSPFASSWPDGLEKVAEEKGFLEKGEGKSVLTAPVPDYAWPGRGEGKFSTAAAGGAGTLLIFGLTFGVAKLLAADRPGTKT